MQDQRSSSSRRSFLLGAAAGAAAAWWGTSTRRARATTAGGAEVPVVLGQGSFRYRVVPGWGVLDAGSTPVKDCHAMAQDRRGRIVLLNNDTHNNVIFYDKSGRLLGTWGHEWPGAHGMTLVNENGEEFLFVTDHDRHQVYKTTIDGKILMTLDVPTASPKFPAKGVYKPTDVVVTPAGDFYVLDGYGTSLIFHYSPRGELKNTFGGRGQAPENVNEAHGGELDLRDPANPVLLVTSRQDHSIKRFKLDGTYVDDIALPNALPCDIIFRGDVAYVPQLRMADDKSHGFVTILDRDNKVISNPGGAPARYDASGKLAPLQREQDVFIHPHGLCVDDEESVYVAQWNANRTYPIKLQRV